MKENYQIGYKEAEIIIKEKFKSMKHGEIKAFVNVNSSIKYPVLLNFLHNKLTYNPQKIIVDCLIGFGYKDVQIKKTISFTFKKP